MQQPINLIAVFLMILILIVKRLLDGILNRKKWINGGGIVLEYRTNIS